MMPLACTNLTLYRLATGAIIKTPKRQRDSLINRVYTRLGVDTIIWRNLTDAQARNVCEVVLDEAVPGLVASMPE